MAPEPVIIGGQPLGAAVDLTQLPEFTESVRGKVITMSATTRIVEKQLKVASERHFEFFSDEPQYLGGDDMHPQPLTYISAGVGF